MTALVTSEIFIQKKKKKMFFFFFLSVCHCHYHVLCVTGANPRGGFSVDFL